MRLRLTDENWVWLRAEDFKYSQLRVTDEQYRLLRATDEYFALHRITDLRTRYAVLLRPKDTVAAADRIPFKFTFAWKPDIAAPVDKAVFEFEAVLKEVVGNSEKLAWTVEFVLKDTATAAEKFSITDVSPFYSSSEAYDSAFIDIESLTKSSGEPSDIVYSWFSAGVKDAPPAVDFSWWEMRGRIYSAAASVDTISIVYQAGLSDDGIADDRLASSMTVLLRDSVVAGSTFSFASDWFVDLLDDVYGSDAFYSTLGAPSIDVVGAADTITIGVRWAIEFYLGGLVFGGSPFGGRTV